MSFSVSQSLQELYLDCRSELEAVLFARLRCRETAADLSQEAFVRLCRSEDLSKVGNLRAYLFRTAQNLLYDHYRSQSVRNATIADWPEPDLPDAPDLRCAETVALSEQALDSLIGSLAELPPLCQRIFYLNRFEGMKQREIAEQLGISVRTVEDNIKRALLHCAKSLAQP
ncbi:RNA polymerase sigma factor [Methylomonas sp. EFPC3]|uniref:RNA polymerase sigma factor n=1 Tax=unclassified Methylomonas TaxID=2608980 RepID=UPI002415B27F|nr:RNA polymerase sigma factor [Methylomonas sp. EFPC3]WFP50864.1 RNA polymerase sigma factor [Methylomonas sp. EFPC3]